MAKGGKVRELGMMAILTCMAKKGKVRAGVILDSKTSQKNVAHLDRMVGESHHIIY